MSIERLRGVLLDIPRNIILKEGDVNYWGRIEMFAEHLVGFCKCTVIPGMCT